MSQSDTINELIVMVPCIHLDPYGSVKSYRPIRILLGPNSNLAGPLRVPGPQLGNHCPKEIKGRLLTRYDFIMVLL